MLGAMHEVSGWRTNSLRARAGRRFRRRPCPLYAGKNRARIAERKSCVTNFEATAANKTVREMDVEEFDLVILGGVTGSNIAAWTIANTDTSSDKISLAT